jgi:hypothetical protein
MWRSEEGVAMFAPPVAKPKSASRDRSAVAAQRPGQTALAQWQLLQRTIGNQAMNRLLAQRAGAASNAPGPIQAKLKVGAVNDPLEHEANRVAGQVMGMPAPGVSVAAAPPQVSRKRADGEGETLQRKPAGPQAASSQAPASVHGVLRSPGQPLDAATRGFFESRFGQDFSGVRVHTDAAAEQSARDVNANAYTAGHNMVFGAGRFAPGTQEGRLLLAHELTHVVQQSGGALAIQRAPDSDSDRDAARKEAEAAIAELEAQQDMDEEEDKPVARSWSRPASLSLLADDPNLCGGQKCVTDEMLEKYAAPDPALAEYRRSEEANAQARMAQQKEEDETRYDRFKVLRSAILDSKSWGRGFTNQLAETLNKLPVRDRQVLFHYGLKWPGRRTKSETFKNNVIESIAKYEDEITGGGSKMGALTPEFIKAEQKEEFNRLWLEGYGSVTGSVLGGLGAWVTSWFTDDPKKISAGANLGAATSGALGALGQRIADKNSYSPDVENQPWDRYSGKRAGLDSPSAANVGSAPARDPVPTPEPRGAPSPQEQKPPVPEPVPKDEPVGAPAAEPPTAEQRTPDSPPVKPTTTPKASRTRTPTKAQKMAKYSEALDKRIADTRAELMKARQRTVEYKDMRAAAGDKQKGGPSKGMWNKQEELYVLERARAYPNRTVLEQARLVGVKGTDGKVTKAADITGEEGRTLDFLEIDGSRVLGGEGKSKAEIVHSVEDLHGPGTVGDFKATTKVGKQRAKETSIIDDANARHGLLVFTGKDVRTGDIYTIEVDPKNYTSTVISYDQIMPN